MGALIGRYLWHRPRPYLVELDRASTNGCPHRRLSVGANTQRQMPLAGCCAGRSQVCRNNTDRYEWCKTLPKCYRTTRNYQNIGEQGGAVWRWALLITSHPGFPRSVQTQLSHRTDSPVPLAPWIPPWPRPPPRAGPHQIPLISSGLGKSWPIHQNPQPPIYR